MNIPIAPWRDGKPDAWALLARGWGTLHRRVDGVLACLFPRQASGREDAGVETQVAVDLCVEEDRIIVNMVLPGTQQEELEIDIHGDLLTVSGEWRVEQESGNGLYRTVRCAYRLFRRKLQLPHQIDAQESQISFHNGLLRIDMPRVNHGSGVATRPVALSPHISCTPFEFPTQPTEAHQRSFIMNFCSETLNGTVRLSGFAKSARDKETGEAIARKVTGVKAVKNEISVRP